MILYRKHSVYSLLGGDSNNPLQLVSFSEQGEKMFQSYTGILRIDDNGVNNEKGIVWSCIFCDHDRRFSLAARRFGQRQLMESGRPGF